MGVNLCLGVGLGVALGLAAALSPTPTLAQAHQAALDAEDATRKQPPTPAKHLARETAPTPAKAPAQDPAPPAPAPATTPAQAAPPTCPPPLPPAVPGATPRDRGLLWRATRDGRSLYLYGTLHVGQPGWHSPGPRTAAALQHSDVLALELDPADPAVQQALARLPAPSTLPPDLQQLLRQGHERACLAHEALAHLHPLLQASTLTVLEARWLGLDPAYAQEQVLAQAARARGLPVLALETPQRQIEALVPADEAQAQDLLRQTLEQLLDLRSRRVLARLSAAWEQGDLATLEDPASWCACIATEADREQMRQVNDARNPALADGIEAQHRAGRRVFAAVGALHMTGPMALQRLLAQRGFVVERVRWAGPLP